MMSQWKLTRVEWDFGLNQGFHAIGDFTVTKNRTFPRRQLSYELPKALAFRKKLILYTRYTLTGVTYIYF